jgi:SAM-dependent methyltransferase
MALEEVLELKGNEVVLDFGCGSGRISSWIAPRVKRVIGLEITREMIDLAEAYRKAENVEFFLYDGVHFPVFSSQFDLIFSVGVLQTMKGEILKSTVSQLAGYLKNGGRFYLIEHVSNNPERGWPSAKEYLQAFEESKLKCLHHYPIRNGRWWMIYLIRYGIIPRRLFSEIAQHEIICRRDKKKKVSYYQDHLLAFKKS